MIVAKQSKIPSKAVHKKEDEHKTHQRPQNRIKKTKKKKKPSKNNKTVVNANIIAVAKRDERRARMGTL